MFNFIFDKKLYNIGATASPKFRDIPCDKFCVIILLIIFGFGLDFGFNVFGLGFISVFGLDFGFNVFSLGFISVFSFDLDLSLSKDISLGLGNVISLCLGNVISLSLGNVISLGLVIVLGINKYCFINSEFENIENNFLFDSLKVNFIKKIRLKFFCKNSFFSNYSFKSFNEDFYITNNFTKNSNTMSQCSRHLRKSSTNF